jgi:hypothetical protein
VLQFVQPLISVTSVIWLLFLERSCDIRLVSRLCAVDGVKGADDLVVVPFEIHRSASDLVQA